MRFGAQQKAHLFADGARAFRKAAAEKKLSFKEVTRSRMEYTRLVTRRKQGRTVKLMRYVHSYVYRKNAQRQGKDLFSALRSLF